MDFTKVGYCQSILETAGISTYIRNQDLVGTMTEVPIPEFFPALCVINDGDYETAIEVLRDRFEEEPGARFAERRFLCQVRGRESGQF